MKTEISEVIIVGAGICGLSLGYLLSQQKRDFLILEKSNSVGGRMATRRNGLATFDHGAQFYKQAPNKTLIWHERAIRQGASSFWFKDEHGIECFSGTQGMTSIAKALNDFQTPIAFKERVVEILDHQDFIEVISESGSRFQAKQVILTCPLPQSLEILNRSQLAYPPELETISYAKALVGLFETKAIHPATDPEVSFRNPGNEIFSITNNQLKKISPVPSYTVVMSPDFSEENFDHPEGKVIEEVESIFLKQMPETLQIDSRQLKKWRFSHPFKTYDQNYFRLASQPNIILGGDAFGGPSIYGAVQSASALMNIL